MPSQHQTKMPTEKEEGEEEEEEEKRAKKKQKTADVEQEPVPYTEEERQRLDRLGEAAAKRLEKKYEMMASDEETDCSSEEDAYDAKTQRKDKHKYFPGMYESII